MIRIAAAQGYWGDWPKAPLLQARSGPVDYLVFDYLAEVTMSILQKQRLRDASQGYARDFVDTVAELAPELAAGKLKILSNAGGVNPLGCARAILAKLKKAIPDAKIKVGVVHGDDLMDRLGSLDLQGLDESAPKFAEVRDRFLSANVYFGAKPLVEALAAGCDIVVSGRVTDTGLTLAPIVHAYGIAWDDWDALATGIVAGHILECGGQASGGNCLARKLSVDELQNLGYPIAESNGPNDLVITKHDKLGGEVSMATVKEQLLYEIGDPERYITPDVVVNFASICVEPDGPNRVRVKGVKGSAATETYKVSCSFEDGYSLFGSMVYTWPDAVGKARTAGELVLRRAKDLGLQFDETRVEIVGLDACHRQIATDSGSNPSEVQLRVAARGRDKEQLERFGRDIVPLVLTGPPGATGFAGGRPRPSEVVAYWPGLIRKNLVEPKVEIMTLEEAAAKV
jgi:hypothetical protein